MGGNPPPGVILPTTGSPSYSDPQQPSMGIGRFRHDLYRGLGSALLELGRGERPELVPVVRRACLTLTSYDPQCEGGRGWYLHQAATLTGQGESIEAEVRERFAHCRPDGWLFSQLEGILLEFAYEGSSPARDALWARYASLNQLLVRTVRRGGWWSQSSLLEGLALDLIDLEGRLGSDSWGVATAMIRGFGEAFMAYRPGSGHERWEYFPDWFDSGVGERFGERAGEYLSDPSPEVVAYAQTRDEAKHAHTESIVRSPGATMENLKVMVRDGANVHQIRGMAKRVAQSKKESKEALAHLALRRLAQYVHGGP